MGEQQVERKAGAVQVVIDAPLHQGAAVLRGAPGDFLAGQPQRAQDAVVERTAGIMRAELAAEGEAQVGRRIGSRPLGAPQVDADQLRRREGERSLLERLARRGGEQALARIEVARGLVQADAFGGLLLDQQEAAAALDDGRHGDRRFPRIAQFVRTAQGAPVEDGGTIA